MRTGRPQKTKPDKILQGIAIDMISAVQHENKDELYNAVKRLWEGPLAPDPLKEELTEEQKAWHRLRAFNRILDSKIRLPSDGGEGETIEMAQEYYREHPELFGFKDYNEYEYIDWVFGDIDTDIFESIYDLEEAKKSQAGPLLSGNFEIRIQVPDGTIQYKKPEDALRFIESERQRLLPFIDKLIEYNERLCGLPLEKDRLAIIRSHYTDGQDGPEGSKLNKRLKSLFRNEKKKVADAKKIANIKALQSIHIE